MAIYKYRYSDEKPLVDCPSPKKAVIYIENADAWDSVESESYKGLCDALHLDYRKYNNFNIMVADIKKAIKRKFKGEEK